jgi:GNAT superfamily N-acetyltransferase
MVVGFASAVHDVHPDKPQELWINEVGVSERHRHKGLAKQILSALLEVGRQFGCTRALVLTDRGNAPAMRLYESLGAEATEQVMFTIHL